VGIVNTKKPKNQHHIPENLGRKIIMLKELTKHDKEIMWCECSPRLQSFQAMFAPSARPESAFCV
jgi:hypothetical protein